LSHRLEVDLDDLGSPLFDETPESRCVSRAPAVHRPWGYAAEHPEAPDEAAGKASVHLNLDLLDKGAAIGNRGIDAPLAGGAQAQQRNLVPLGEVEEKL